ncbi:unnamed protein product [Nippostrongylus brasiliensis]|uniref:GLOBIN domain-containing protein n=1 Tax=Nippostrongylus brasiliensis TaxID=27835 RepID=A0A0N4YVG8_NIPBR|nr:hypothetical protein Q1695_002328 [Nippostrongylus brasiliensis]VDL80560.1 unnamed protein product [Nippostrongylus brasiliensis]VDL84983.1 unnamed protein product [Nippostrongylus brasiliensis]
MGNAESSDSLSVKSRARSQSPTQNGESSISRGRSVRSNGTRRCLSDRPPRRSKTCRHRTSRMKVVCSVTGLTLHQKALLNRKWNRMDTATIYELGRRMFASIFAENPHYLAYLDLKNEPNWRNHINFKIHVQRFVTALSEAMRRLSDPATSCDVLRDFGASYAAYPKRVSAMYFERLANALNQTATQLQEGDHQSVEVAAVRNDSVTQSVDESVVSLQREKSIRSLADSERSTKDELLESASLSSFPAPRFTSSRGSLSMVDSLRDSHADCLDHGPHDVCPITAEAWTVLSAFLANQIKYGYEMERVIRTELSKLGLDGSGGMKRGALALQRPTQFA